MPGRYVALNIVILKTIAASAFNTLTVALKAFEVHVLNALAAINLKAVTKMQ